MADATPTTYIVFKQIVVDISDDPLGEDLQDVLVRIGEGQGSVQAAIRQVWKALPVEERPGADTTYVAVPERSLHELLPEVIGEPQLKFRT